MKDDDRRGTERNNLCVYCRLLRPIPDMGFNVKVKIVKVL